MAWEDFGQKVDLTARIREILLNYPEGTSILKELIQNADDARASCVRFCLDHRQHTTDQLLGPGMAPFQGPALLVYNDAVFSETDFQSISRIGDSLKRGQAGKTGRFGIGFNSCYHLTDVPSFVSGSHLAIFDPHCKHLPNISSTNPGKRINFVEAQAGNAAGGAGGDGGGGMSLGQLVPYQGVFGCNLMHAKPWEHTLFRFPLRSEAQAQVSTISKQAYSTDKVRSLLHQLSIESHAILLFLKTISLIEISEWCAGAAGPTTLFTCSISNSSTQLAAERTLFARASAALVGSVSKEGPAPGQAAVQQGQGAAVGQHGSVFVLDVQMQHHTAWGPAGPTGTQVVQGDVSGGPSLGSVPGITTRQYLISQLLGSGALTELARELSKQFTVPLVPWAAVAADVTPTADMGAGAVAAQPDPGQAYCFLPLPAFTGLPVHVNAFFELSSNRRDIWHGEDMAGVGAARAAWNKALLSEVAAEAYANLIQYATRHLGPGQRFLSLWPSKTVSAPWQALLKAVFLKLADRPVIHSAAAGGQWLVPDQCLLPDQECTDKPVLARAVESAGLPLASTTPALLKMWLDFLPTPPRHITPEITRSHFQRSTLQVQALAVRDAATAAVVLDYCLTSVDVTSSAAAAQQLAGLRLVPMLDGRVSVIQGRDVPTRLFVPDELELQLLQDTAPDVLVNCGLLNDESVSRLWALTQLEVTSVSGITNKAMAQHLIPRLITRPGGATGPGARWGGTANSGHITKERMVLLWRWLSQQSSLQDFVDTPVLPVLPAATDGAPGAAAGAGADGALRGGVEEQGDLVPLGTIAHSSVLCPLEQELQLLNLCMMTTSKQPASTNDTDSSSQASKLPPGSSEAALPAVIRILPSLLDLGVRVVDTGSFPALPHSLLTQSHCQTLDAPGVLAALSNLNLPALKAALSKSQPSLCHELRALIATRDCIHVVLGQRPPGARQATIQARPFNPQTLLAALVAMPIWRAPGQQDALVDLSGTCFLQPDGFDASLLTSFKYVIADSAEQAGVMCDHLGVKKLTLAQVYQQHVIPNLLSLPAPARESLTRQLLRSLPTVLPSDPTLLPLLASIPIVPNASGVLRSAGQLYDPRREDLTSLLDPDTSFPAGPFAEDATLLDGLVLLGLRQEAGRDTVLQAARFVQHCAERADAVLAAAPVAGTVAPGAASDSKQRPGQAFGLQGSEATGEELAIMAMARGKALLEFLELEASRLVEPSSTSSTGTSYSYPQATSGAGGGTTRTASAAAAPEFNPLDRAAKKLGGLFAKVQGILSKLGDEEEAPGRQITGAGGTGGDGSVATAQEVRQREAQERLVKEQQEIKQFWSDLAAIRWCPVFKDAPDAGLPWRSLAGRAPVAPPSHVRPEADMWLASASLHVLLGECRSSALASGLSWSSPLKGVILGRQLKQLGELHRDLGSDEQGVQGVQGGAAEPVREQLAQKLAEVVPQLYRALGGLAAPELQSACALLAHAPCVWVGRGFAPAHKVAFQGSLDLSPWLYVLPSELAPFKQLLKQFGATESFSSQQYVSLLSDMYTASLPASSPASRPAAGSIPPAPTAAKLAPLDGHQLGQAIAAVQALADMHDTESVGAGVIYVPDEKGCLAKASELAFNDAPWMDSAVTGLNAGPEAMATKPFVHPKISNHVAERVGVASVRRLLLARASDSVTLSLVNRAAGSEAAEAFGQSEALTTRLRHIIQDYPEGPGVLLELLQNADDAGASQLRLMLDLTTYPSGSILAPTMSAMQGPALLAFNDATFSPADFSAIIRIGQDAKLSRPTSIGRFGLGFNAVYHLTDVPSFVSGEYLVLFDPHAKYLPGVSYAQPGLRFAFQRANLLAQFPDAFMPYTHFGCTLKEPYAGTLFRFPLRTPDTAAASDIKPGVSCGPQEVLSLFESFGAYLPHALLFLKSVKSVEVLVRVPGYDTPQLLYSARAQPTSSAPGQPAQQQHVSVSGQPLSKSSLQEPVMQFLKEAAAGVRTGQSQIQGIAKALSKVTQQSLPIGLGSLELQMRQCPEVLSHLKSVLRAGGLAGGDASPTAHVTDGLVGDVIADSVFENQRWLVCNTLGGGAARDIAVQVAGSSGVKMIPWVGLAARLPSPSPSTATPVSALDKAGPADVDVKSGGQAYCFLPLPIKTKLPVHINAFFELSSNRRDIWYGGDMAGMGAQRAAWNAALLADGLAPAYARLLVKASADLGPGDHLYRLFPPGDLAEPWSHLSKSFYQLLQDQPLLWVAAQGGKWLKPTQVVLAGSVAADPHTCRLPHTLSTLDMLIAQHLPPWLEQTILQLTPGATPLTPSLARSHLSSMLKKAGSRYVSQRLAQADEHVGTKEDTCEDAVEENSQKRAETEAKPVRPAPAAASLLEFCLSDLQPLLEPGQQQQQQGGDDGGGAARSRPSSAAVVTLASRLQWLDGCPLLPLADNTLAEIRTVPTSMSGSPVYLLPRTPLEAHLLSVLPGRTLKLDLPPGLTSVLVQLAATGLINVQLVTPGSLNTHLLPFLFPASWKGKELVDIAAEPDQPANLTEDWLQLLWQFLGTYPEPAHVLHLTDWAVLPVKGGKLARCLTPSKVLHVGDWQEMLTQSLTRLGCVLLDTDILTGASQGLPAGLPAAEPDQVGISAQTASQRPDADAAAAAGDGAQQQGGNRAAAAGVAVAGAGAAAGGGHVSILSSAALQLVVQAPSLPGILKALQAVKEAAEARARRALAAQSGTASTQQASAGQGLQRPGPTSGRFVGKYEWPGLEPSAVRHLRSYLLQEKWFATSTSEPLTPELLAVLFSLPVYELYSCTTDTLGPATPASAVSAQQPQAGQTGAAVLTGMLTAASHYSNLDPAVMYLPPDVPLEPQLLGLQCTSLGSTRVQRLSHSFLKCEDEGEARVLLQLGVRRMAMSDLVKLHVHELVRIGCMPSSSLQLFLLRLLHSLHQARADAARDGAALSDEHTKMMDHLRSLPLFPVPGPGTTSSSTPTSTAPGTTHIVPPDLLRTPEQLYDPRVTSLKQVLDPSTFFPAPPFDSDLVALDMLQTLGMRNNVTLPVLVSACDALNREYQRLATAQLQRTFQPGSSTPAWAAPLLSRSQAILSHLNSAAREAGGSVQPASSETAPVTEQAVGAPDDSAAWKRLQQLVWCPVVLQPPEPGLPWPAAGQPLLAAPRHMRPTSYCWLASHAQHLVDTSCLTAAPAGDQPLSKELCAALGWDQPPHPAVLCQQLTELGKMYALKSQLHQDNPAPPTDPAASPQPAATDAAAAQQSALQPDASDVAISSQEVLIEHQEQPGPSTTTALDTAAAGTSADLSSNTLTAPQPSSGGAGGDAGASIAGSHTEAGVVAPLNMAAVEEGLHQVYKAMLESCEGQGLDLISMTFERGDKPCIWVGQGLVPPIKAMLYPSAQWRPWLWSVPTPFIQYTSLFSLLGVCEAPGPSNFKAALTELALLADGAPLPSTQDLAAALALAEAMAESANQQGQPVGLGDVMLPDCEAVMRPASHLFFNDAEWLNTGDILLSHPSLTHATAEVLGVRSLRYRQQHLNQGLGSAARGTGSATSLPCLNPGHLGQMLGLKDTDDVGPDVVQSFLSDLIEVVDLLGATHLTLTLDLQQHAAQSLLHPGLGQYQGPALCITLPGVEVTPGELGDLLAPASVSPGNADAGSAVSIRGQQVSQGMGLLLAFALSELPQVISGPLTFMWDPAGRCLTRSAQEEAATGGSAAGPRAQIYKHVEGQLHRTFADQYGSAWGFAEGCDVRRPLKATVIRLPLATTRNSQTGSKPALGWRTASVEAVEQGLAAWFTHAGHSLLFCKKLQAIMIRNITTSSPASSPASEPPVAAAPPTKVLKTLYQAALSWDPDRPRHTFGQPLPVAAPEQPKATPLGNRLLSAAFGKMQAAAGAVGGALSKVQAAAGVPALVSARKEPAYHETTLDLVSAIGDKPLASESWLVSTYLGQPPASHQQQSPGSSSSKDILTAVAVCLSRDDEAGLKTLVPASGLYPLLPSLNKPLPEPAAADPGNTIAGGGGGVHDASRAVSPGQALSHLKFLVFGNLFWTRSAHGQRRIVPLLSDDEHIAGPAPAAVAVVAPTSGPASGASAAPSTGADVQGLRHQQQTNAPHQGLALAGEAALRRLGAAVGPATVGMHQPPSGYATPIADAARGQPLPPISVPAAPAPGMATQPTLLPQATTGTVSRLDGVSLHIALRSSHNRRVIEQLGVTWAHALQVLLDADSFQTAARAAQGNHTAVSQRAASSSSTRGMVLDAGAVYEVMMPNLGRHVEAGLDVLSRTCVSRMYHTASMHPVWRLRSGRLVHIPQGYFLCAAPPTTAANNSASDQADPATAASRAAPGPAAVAFIHQYMPIFDVPDYVLAHLKAAHIPNYHEVTPDSLRAFLKHHSSRWHGVKVVAAASSQLPGSGASLATSSHASLPPGQSAGAGAHGGAGGAAGAGGPQYWSVTVDSLAQLLTYCMSDVDAKARPSSSGTHHQHHQPNQQQVPQQAAAGHQHASAAPATSAAYGYDAGGVGARQGGPGVANPGLDLAPMLNVVQGFITSVGDTMNRAIDTVLETAGTSTGALMQPGAGSTGSDSSQGGTGSGLEQVWSEERLRDCVGLPVPTVSGHIVPLGPRQAPGRHRIGAGAQAHAPEPPLLVIPPSCGQEAAKLLPPQCHSSLLHPQAFQALLDVQAGAGSAGGSGSRQAASGGEAGRRRRLFQSRVARDILGVQLYSFQDLSIHLADVLSTGWSEPGLRPLAPGWDCPGVQHPTLPSSSSPGRGLGKVWDLGHLGSVQGPRSTWLSGVFSLIQGLATGSQLVGDTSSRMSLSHLDPWALLPTLPMYPAPPGLNRQPVPAGDDKAALLVYVAHRAVVVALPPAYFSHVPAAPAAGDVVSGHVEPADAGGSGSVDAQGEEEGAERPLTVPQLLSQASSPTWRLVVQLLTQAGVPVLDPRFTTPLTNICQPHIEHAEGPVTVLIRKLRWTNQVLCAATAGRVSSGGGAPADTQRLALNLSSWDESSRAGLLALLTAHLNSNELEADDVSFLGLLPIYPTHASTRTSLIPAPISPGEPPVKPAACPLTLFNILPGLMDALPAAQLSHLLVSSREHQGLFEVLGVEQLTAGTLLGQVVVPLMDQLPDILKAGVLTYIKDHWSSLKDTPSLVTALSQCAFVTSESAEPGTATTPADVGSGSHESDALRKPSDLFDPFHPLYGMVYKGTGRFPSGQFAFPAWLTVLRGVGLMHKVTQDSFMQAAAYVEGLGKQVLQGGLAAGSPAASSSSSLSARQQHVLRAAEALWTYLKAHSMELNGGDFLKRVSQVAFVPANFGIPGGRATPTLVKYSDAAHPKDWPLCWTVAPVLSPNDVSEVPAIMMQFFRVKSPPPASVVLQHLTQVGRDGGQEVLGSWPPDAPLKVEAAFTAIWDYLDAEGVRQEDTGRLRNIAFVPVANASQLVAPAHMCMRLKDDLSPLAYEVPSAYLNRVPLLRKLGCQEGPTAQWLLNLLESQAASAAGRALNANQRRACIRALNALQTLTAPDDQVAVKEARGARRLLVLTADGRLRWPGDVVVDSSTHAGGSRLTGRIDTAHMVFAHPQLPRSTAVWLGCAALQDKVEEVLDTSGDLTPVTHVGGVQLEATQALLTSNRFVDACYSCVQSHMHSIKGMEHMPIQQVAAALRTLASQLVFVSQLHTCIVLKDSQRNITRASASTASARVYEFSCSRTGKHYIAEPPAGLPAAQLLAAAVSRVLKSPVTLPLQPLFTCPAEDIQDLQPILLPGGYDRALELAGRAGEPGEPLLPTDRPLVTLRALRRYTAGELVAVSRAEVVAAATAAGLRGNLLRVPSARTAAAEAALRRAAGASSGGGAASDDMQGGSEDGGPGGDLCYAKVVADSAPSGVVPLYRVPLEVEPGVVLPMLSVHVYSFRAPTAADESAASSAADVSTPAATTTTTARPGGSAAQPALSRPAVADVAPTGSGAASSAGPSRGVQSGPVGSAEMMGAVRDMLGAVGLKLEAGQEELMRSCADLRLKLEESQGQLSQAKQGLSQHKEELERTRGKWECKICTTNEVNACYQKCGHMVCWDCGQSVRNGRCPVCRKQSDIMRLF